MYIVALSNGLVLVLPNVWSRGVDIARRGVYLTIAESGGLREPMASEWNRTGASVPCRSDKAVGKPRVQTADKAPPRYYATGQLRGLAIGFLVSCFQVLSDRLTRVLFHDELICRCNPRERESEEGRERASCV